MFTKATILDQDEDRHNRPCELTAEEVFLLMRTYTADKTCITEEDALTLCRWAEAQKLGAYTLFLVLEGRASVSVEAGVVRIGPPGSVR